MLKTLVPTHLVSQFSKTDLAYSKADPALAPFYKYPHERLSFKKIIADKNKVRAARESLVEVLLEQYADLPNADFVRSNIEALASDTTFTVTTAHQPCLFLGPLYVVYKAFTTINLAEAVTGLVDRDDVIVPIFVLGGEDHDLDEMNHISLFNKEIVWETKQTGSVGKMSTTDMEEVLQKLNDILGTGEWSRTIYKHIEAAYKQPTVGKAVQAILHDIFGSYGMVVLDMNDARLKRHFIPIMKDELLNQTAFAHVSETIEQLSNLGFKTQAAPREINLFYMLPGMRERIVLEDGTYKVLNTEYSFSEAEILAELEAHPERFSPNVILRPLYQEMILPNLAYVGGGGELAYWLERKSLFEHYDINYPLLVRRSSVTWYDKDTVGKLKKLDISYANFFQETDSLVRNFVEAQTDLDSSLELEKAELSKIFADIVAKAMRIDPTLERSVKAEETKQLGVLDNLQNRMHRAEKAKHEAAIGQLQRLKERTFPNNGLQERNDNFMQFYARYGGYYFKTLKEHLKPMERGMVVLVDDRE